MASFMDIHRNVESVTPEELKEAHQKDLQIQSKHGVIFQKYWYSQQDKTVFCLAEAPNKEAAEAVHREAHGGIADEIIEVKEGE